MEEFRRPREDGTRLLRRRVGIATAALFVIAQLVAVFLLVSRWWHVAALGYWASAADRARVGFDPLLAAMAGWGILLAGLAVVWALRRVAMGRWSGELAVLILGLLVGGMSVSAVPRFIGKHFDGPPLMRVPFWVHLSGDVATGVGTIVTLAFIKVFLDSIRRDRGPSTQGDALFVGAFAVAAAMLQLHDGAIHSCALYSADFLPPPSLAGVLGERLIGSWGAIALGWLGMAALAMGMTALQREGEGGEESC